MTISLAVFDLDGTLTATNEVDTSCFVEAVHAEFGFTPESDWGAYQHCTDQGIAAEMLERHLGGPPTRRQLRNLARRFVDLLGAAASRDPQLFSPVQGARELLRHLSDSGWLTCIATGAWQASAQLKLHAAGLPADLPLFCSDDLVSREAIVSAAIAHGQSIADGPIEHIVAVGDGVWDVATARNLRLPFVGVAHGRRAERLRKAGARIVLADFSDLPITVRHLETAPVPMPPACEVSANPSLQRTPPG